MSVDPSMLDRMMTDASGRREWWVLVCEFNGKRRQALAASLEKIQGALFVGQFWPNVCALYVLHINLKGPR